MTTQVKKAEALRALYLRGRAFVIPNPWDAGSARLLARLGFEALATTSVGLQEAGADVLYAPGLTTAEQVKAVVTSVDRPVNVVVGLVPSRLTVAELEALGVARISVGSALARRAYGAVLAAAREMLDRGTFGFADEAAPLRDLEAMFVDRPGLSP